ncbi:oligopeptide/dipeptide ABC transporter ATP-binding protein [Sporosarcina sp. FSL K6-1522]|uniref:ABC transporter ATP-binding protein n=1 Tax=Sporosarcina sp. FSL K6-1522 TaxID=2921554 RepID=UPI00315A2FF1
MQTDRKKLLEVKQLKKHFQLNTSTTLKAVDGLTFDIYKGEILGLVGESGCGKSTTGRTIIQLYDPTEGEVIFNGKNVNKKQSKKELLEFRRKVQMIFQDPYASLNPRMSVRETISAGLVAHKLVPKKELNAYIEQLLETVGLNAEHANRYPHEFSGGQRQRIGIARAISLNPEFIIADEPISALDVSIQAQIVNLLKDLQLSHDLTILFIAHDLAMVKHISDRIGVMYLGHMVELATATDLYENPLHPYTEALLSAIPMPNPKTERSRERIILQGDVPSPISPPSGCPFRTRCAKAFATCSEVKPEWKEVRDNHWVACHLYNEKN